MIDFIVEVFGDYPEYLKENAIELVIVGLAFCFSKSKLIPGFIVCYIAIMTIIFGETNSFLSNLERFNPTPSYYNKWVGIVYLFEASVMLFLLISSMLNVSKLRAVLSIVIFTQMSLSLMMALQFYGYSAGALPYVNELSEFHYSAQRLFVILYCAIAWMCVYYSRKDRK